jgi:hypothetical protein
LVHEISNEQVFFVLDVSNGDAVGRYIQANGNFGYSGMAIEPFNNHYYIVRSSGTINISIFDINILDFI